VVRSRFPVVLAMVVALVAARPALALAGLADGAKVATGGTSTVTVTLPAAIDLGLPPGLPAAITSSERRWRGIVLASVAAERSTKVLDLAVAGGDPQVDFTGSLRTSPGVSLRAPFPLLGTVDATRLQAQADANLGVVRAQLGGAVVAAGAQLVPTGSLQAVIFTLEVGDLEAVRVNLGNLLIGLQTGLTGGTQSTASGSAIRVYDHAGHAAGAWSATEAGVGIVYTGKPSGGTQLVADWPFTNLSGATAPAAPLATARPAMPAIKLSLGGRSLSAAPLWQTCATGSACATHAPPKVKGCLPRAGSVLKVTLPAGATQVDVALQRVRARKAVAALEHRPARPADANGMRWRVTLPPAVRARAGAVMLSVAFSGQPAVTYLAGVAKSCPR
jgi:hypothetical protein